MVDVRFRGTKEKALELARSIGGILSGRLPDPNGIASSFWGGFSMAAFESISDAYNIKSQGGVDDMGIQWDPLKASTIARRRTRGTPGQVSAGAGVTDFVRSASGHPRSATTSYTFTTSQAFTDTSGAEPGRSKEDDGGVLVADGESVTITHSSTGNRWHRPQVGVSVPTDGEVTVTTTLNGMDLETYKLGAGEPADSTDYTVEPLPQTLALGDDYSFKFEYSHPSPGGQDTELLIDFATVSILDSAPVDANTLVWAWIAGDATYGIDKTDYDDFIDPANPSTAFTLETNGRITADSQQRLTFGPSPQQLQIPIHYEVPTMRVDGTMDAFSKLDRTNAHSMWQVRNSGVFFESFYFSPRVRYRFEGELEIAAQGVTDWASLDWCVLFQMHPSTFPSGHSQVPPLIFYIRGQSDQFQILTQGNTLDPVGPTYNTTDELRWPFVDGYHTFAIEWVMDPDGSDSFIQMEMDRVIKWQNTNPFGLLWSAVDTTDAFTQCTFGTYTSLTPDPEFPTNQWHSVRVYEVA